MAATVTEEGWDAKHSLGRCRHCGNEDSYNSETDFFVHINQCAMDSLSRKLRQRFGSASSGGFASDSSSETSELTESAALEDIRNTLEPDERGRTSPPAPLEEAPEPVHLGKDWQERYIRAHQQSDPGATQAPEEADSDGFEVVLVGRAGVGKGSLLNHILDNPDAFISASAGNTDAAVSDEESVPAPVRLQCAGTCAGLCMYGTSLA
jgi:hypothetical protein